MESAERPGFERCDPAVVEQLAKDYAQYTRSNLAMNHGDLVETVINLEDQLSTFTQMLQLIDNDSTGVCGQALPEISSQFQALRPAFRQIDKVQELVDRVQQDMDAVEAQLTAAEESTSKGTLKDVFKTQLSLFTRDRSIGSTSRDSITASYEPVGIFKAKDYFKPEN